MIIKPPKGTLVDFSIYPYNKLAGYWPFLEGSGNRALDSTLNRNHGTLLGFSDPSTATSGWNPGRRGKSLKLNGTTNYITMGNVLNMGTKPFTVSCWLYLDSSYSGSMCRVVQKRGTGGAGTAAGWMICVRNNVGVVEIYGAIWDDGAGHFYYIATTGYDSPSFAIGLVNAWIHLAVVFDAIKKLWQFYVNGELNQNIDVSAKNIGSVNNSRQLTAGASDNTLGQYFKGFIDEVMIFDGALTKVAIKRLVVG